MGGGSGLVAHDSCGRIGRGFTMWRWIVWLLSGPDTQTRIALEALGMMVRARMGR